MTDPKLKPDFRETLYTVDQRGNRQWVYAAIVDGRFRKWRRWVTIALMAFYLAMPWISIDGKQGIFLNIAHRKFTFFGTTLIATDTIYLFLLLAVLALTLFFVTAIIGRIWCGWACPETVFLEFLFRPIERWIEGDHLAQKKLDESPWTWDKIRKKALKHAINAIVSWWIASTFLAYFVGRDSLLHMMSRPPWENPLTFGMTLVLMGAMAFQLGWFREQFCTIVCPYGRFQSVLLDARSWIIGYDFRRGEPRGKSASGQGDCVDCGNCVKVCPTGIDIRNGLQLECINCAACIDACDAVMTRLKKPLGLIRYASQKELEGETQRFLRPRIVIYALLLVGLTGTLVYRLSTREDSEFHIVRGALDAPFTLTADQKILNHLHLRLTNKSEQQQSYTIEMRGTPEGGKLIVPLNPYPVAADQTVTVPLFVEFPPSWLERGRKKIGIQISTDSGYRHVQEITVLGPGQ